MYNELIRKLGYLFPRGRSTVDDIDVQFHGLRLNSLPKNVERPKGQRLNNRRGSRIQVANCKGHILGSKAIRRHLGVPLSSNMPSKERKSEAKSFNISQGLAAAIYNAVDNQSGCQGNYSEAKIGRRKTRSSKKDFSGCNSDRIQYSSRSFKIDYKPCFKNLAKANEKMFLSDTNLLDTKRNTSEMLSKGMKMDKI